MLRTIAFSLAVLAGTATHTTAQEPGAILRVQKVTSLRGGFPGPVNDFDQLGRALLPLGDMNGDGIGDLAVSVHGSDDGGTDRGAFWLATLRKNGKVLGAKKISDLEGGFQGLLTNDDELGRALADLGDLNGDGVRDLAVGASKDDDGGPTKGAVWILFMSEEGLVVGEQKISSVEGGFGKGLMDKDQFGRALANLGDLDGDGRIELAVGATFADGRGVDRGAVWILSLNPDGTVQNKLRIGEGEGGFREPLQDRDYFGMALASVGDLDGDGINDLAVGAPGDRDGGGDAGAVYLLFMRSNGMVREVLKISEGHGGFVGPLDPGDYFGYSVAAIGDVDGNGITELAVGAWGEDDPDPVASARGAVWILFLGPDARVIRELRLAADLSQLAPLVRAGDWFGSAVTGLGDHDGDGFNDLAVGARFDDEGGPGRGAFYVILLAGAFPSASFRVADGPTPLSIAFENRSRGVIDDYHWDFGDGTTSEEEDPVHRYGASGTYRVVLRVTGPGGMNAAVASTRLEIEPAQGGVQPTGGTAETPGPDGELQLGLLKPYGSFVNPPGSLAHVEGEPSLGAGIVLEAKDPLGTRPPATPALFLYSLSPDPAHPEGTLLPNYGLRPNRVGELLVALGPSQVIHRSWGDVDPTTGNQRDAVAIPARPELLGLSLFGQAVLVDSFAGQLRLGLTNGIEIQLGP